MVNNYVVEPHYVATFPVFLSGLMFLSRQTSLINNGKRVYYYSEILFLWNNIQLMKLYTLVRLFTSNLAHSGWSKHYIEQWLPLQGDRDIIWLNNKIGITL